MYLKNYLLQNYLLERLLKLRLLGELKFLEKLGTFKSLRLCYGLPMNGQKSKRNGKTARRLNVIRLKG